ncbi:MAG: class I SAM-dependent methyltransferase [Candidatus Nanoarchaeia archaeon]|nr:class I SAM-dependent methyltransferase [Candidatus Nanoarchaeia archaeon]
MDEKKKYINIYSGELSEFYKKNDNDGIIDGGYGRRCWGLNIIPHLRQLAPISLLDVGCGFGVFLDKVSEFIPEVWGVDIASVSTGNIINNPKIKFISGEAKDLSMFKDNSIDWLTSFDCIEHCLPEDIDTIFSEFNRVTKKGFILSISYDECRYQGIEFHMTVKPKSWWIDKIKKYGKIIETGEIPIIGGSYILCYKEIK